MTGGQPSPRTPFDVILAFRLYQRWREPPRATLALLTVLVVFFALSSLLNSRRGFEAMLLFGAEWGPGIERGDYWRLISCSFLHANSFHLLMNGSALLILGTLAERVLGWQRCLFVYALAGLVGGMASWRLSPDPSVGASGAIMGLLGAMTVFGLRYRRHLPEWLRSLFGPSLWMTILLNVIVGVVAYWLKLPIDVYAHGAGFSAGVAAGLGMGNEVDPHHRRNPLLVGLLAAMGLAVVYTWWMMFQQFFLLWLRGRSWWG